MLGERRLAAIIETIAAMMLGVMPTTHFNAMWTTGVAEDRKKR